MILYCDSSALLKIYLREEASEAVLEQARAVRRLSASRITYAECLSAFSRRIREQPADEWMFNQARLQFRADWAECLHIELTQPLVELAGEYADTFALRGYDSVQLASVHFLHRELPGQIRFACFDHRLLRAARVLGIVTE